MKWYRTSSFTRHCLVLAALVCAVSPGESGAETQPVPKVWTARQAVIFALNNSPDSTIAKRRIEAAQADIRLADSAFQPQLNLSAGYAHTDNPMYSFGNILNQGQFSPDIDFNEPGHSDNLNMKAEVLYRFYNGGRDSAGLEAAEAGRQASEQERSVTEHQLGLEVVRAFQRIIQSRDQVQARQAELEAIGASLAVAAARHEAGDLLRAELLNFEVQHARASENMIISRHRLELAEKVFLNLLGLEQGAVQVNDTQGVDQPVPTSDDYQPRPELTGLDARIAILQAELKQAAGAREPTFDGFASYQYDHGYVLDGSGDSWMAGVKISYTLYDGQQVSAQIAKIQAQHDELIALTAKIRLAVNLEIQEAELNYRQALERRSVTDKMVQVARESAQLSRERFKEGLILSSDLIDTELRLTDAVVRQSTARANYRMAIGDLRRAAGMQQFAPTTEDLLETRP